MKISTKGRYALRLMLDLALNDTGNISRSKVLRPGRRFLKNIWNRLSGPEQGGLCKERARRKRRLPAVKGREGVHRREILRLTGEPGARPMP